MLRNRNDPMNVFEMVPKLGREMDPELVHLDRLLDDAVTFQEVRADLLRRYPPPATRGRNSTPVEVILRMLLRQTAVSLELRGDRARCRR